ncbi:CPBP family intramembrane metalloprotease [bacterium]|nr:CPBP family intramembrane metalloprotease [bacterium]
MKIVFLTAVGSFLILGLPGYALLRKSAAVSDSDLEEGSSTAVITPLDLLVVGLYILVFAGFLKGTEYKMNNPEELKISAGVVMASSITMLLIAGVVPAVLFWRVKLVEVFGLRWMGWRNIFWIMPAFVFSMMVVGALMVASGWQTWVQDSLGSKPQEAVTLVRETSDIGLLVAMAVAAIIFAPIAEEVIFRGYLYPVVKKFTDRWFAAVFTGVFFGVIHFNLMALPMLALMGVVLAVVYEKSGSLWVPIGCHAAFNAISVGLMLISRVYEFPGQP